MRRYRLVLATLGAVLMLGACAAPRQYTRLDPSLIDPPDVHIEGDHVTIDDVIHFDLDSHHIQDQSAGILDHLAQFLVNHQTEYASVRIIGHADAHGTPEHNQILSERRAGAVRRALMERGVEVALEAQGRGVTEHVCTEDTEACHQLNRRVEFVVFR
jgi:outer membrane protein OmpA-like peptidoglycan-associated protein